MKKKILFIIFLFVTIFAVSTIVLVAKKSQSKSLFYYVTHKTCLVRAEKDSFSPIIDRVKYGQKVKILQSMKSKVYNFIKVQTKSGKVGYVHKDAVISVKAFMRNARKIKKKNLSAEETKRAQKGFDEDDTVAAAVKGFDEDDEVTAAIKGFDEDDTVTAACKGFNKQVERAAKKKNKKYRYDLVDKAEKRYKVANPYEHTMDFRKAGVLGEFYPKRNLRRKPSKPKKDGR